VWGFIFGLLFFIPLFGMVGGAGIGALMGLVEKTGIDKEFQVRVRRMLEPGTLALFLIAEEITLDKTIDALSKFGGTVLKTSLSKDAEADFRRHCTEQPSLPRLDAGYPDWVSALDRPGASTISAR